ncbi:MAG TPA: hypothetical protein VH701_16630 [Vicinamibacterales bacterium]|jgi:hypothetical protein
MAELPMDAMAGPANTLRGALRPGQTPQSCRWGASTLYLAFPHWLKAWDSPWSCGHPSHKGPLETVETCTMCPDWTPRELPRDRREGPESS